MSGDVEPLRTVVLGSVVFDLAVQVERVPATHETVLATGVTLGGGGKGLCQAIAAQRLGADVELVGRVGEDLFGDFLIRLIEDEGIRTEHTRRDPAGTHLGIPIITPDGNNRIIGVPRASWKVSPGDVDDATEPLSRCALLLLQGETPLNACLRALELVSAEATVVWNPAPATFTLDEMLDGPGARVSWITPNETEARALTGVRVTDRVSAMEAAQAIRAAYSGVGVVVTIGDRGAVACDAAGVPHYADPFSVAAVDTTAAGDVFTAAFGVALATHGDVARALRFASASGASAVTRPGAVASIPTAAQVQSLLEYA